eukprot:m.144719 g.144719  ORF g.144719 m.144719 type:complete len:82 (-) comp30391_c0_seq1:146-391(-)
MSCNPKHTTPYHTPTTPHHTSHHNTPHTAHHHKPRNTTLPSGYTPHYRNAPHHTISTQHTIRNYTSRTQPLPSPSILSSSR